MHIFGIHQTIYAALTAQVMQPKVQKSRSLENNTFSPKICNSVTENPKNLNESEKMWTEEKGNSKTF